MGILEKNGDLIVFINLADAAGLLLCEQYPSVGCANQPVAVVGSNPATSRAGLAAIGSAPPAAWTLCHPR